MPNQHYIRQMHTTKKYVFILKISYFSHILARALKSYFRFPLNFCDIPLQQLCKLLNTYLHYIVLNKLNPSILVCLNFSSAITCSKYTQSESFMQYWRSQSENPKGRVVMWWAKPAPLVEIVSAAKQISDRSIYSWIKPLNGKCLSVDF